jgi:hypothetical protein
MILKNPHILMEPIETALWVRSRTEAKELMLDD